ncbi:MAG TPA: riboflavin synthase [Candidatus Acidoferrales bacterium]|jgi:riboflavin synthase|nr:riboflavin synthase [Candidatus Acidoferrales bacterium]
MFTGLIEDVGKIESLRVSGRSAVLTVKTNLSVGGMKLGASIAVNGACLSVVKKGKRNFTVDVSPETLQRTNLEKQNIGSLVNLELPMRLADRLGGHLVTGHVDGVGTIASVKRKGDFTFFTFRVPPKLGSLLVSKGSVAVDGISLTVNECSRERFSVVIIPLTLQNTNLRTRSLGDKVNIETDLIGKYVQSFVAQQR